MVHSPKTVFWYRRFLAPQRALSVKNPQALGLMKIAIDLTNLAQHHPLANMPNLVAQ